MDDHDSVLQCFKRVSVMLGEEGLAVLVNNDGIGMFYFISPIYEKPVERKGLFEKFFLTDKV